MRLHRQTRLVAAIVMLFCMLVMQAAIASCRCLGSELGRLSAAAVVKHDAAAHAAEHHFHAHPDTVHDYDDKPGDGHGPSCDNCPASQQLNKRVHDHVPHPEVAPFVTGILLCILAPLPVALPASTVAQADIHIQATAPPVCIRDCTFQL